jgi:hypothetical protein
VKTCPRLLFGLDYLFILVYNRLPLLQHLVSLFYRVLGGLLSWRAGGTILGTDFDGNASHSTAELGAVLDKEFVVVSASCRASVDELESVEIQLTLEGA